MTAVEVADDATNEAWFPDKITIFAVMFSSDECDRNSAADRKSVV